MKHFSAHYPTPATTNPSARSMDSPIHPAMALLHIWGYPRQTLRALTTAAGWSWVIPIGLALLGFYGRLFARAFLGVPPQDIIMAAGVMAILLGWPLRVVLLYGASSRLGGQPDLFPLLLMTAWASLPLTLRHLIQLLYMVSTGEVLLHPGLSGLLTVADGSGSVPLLLYRLLGTIDLYSLWHLLLLLFSVQIAARLSLPKALAVVACYGGCFLFIGSLAALV